MRLAYRPRTTPLPAHDEWRRRWLQSQQQRTHREHRANERELTDFYADVEAEERHRQLVLRQADFWQRTGKAETMQEPEAEGHDPRPSRD